jgi:hypothetical protein
MALQLRLGPTGPVIEVSLSQRTLEYTCFPLVYRSKQIQLSKFEAKGFWRRCATLGIAGFPDFVH